MAGFLQARACTDERMKKMNLEIAKRTIQKDLQGMETERQLKLYLMILEELGDWETIDAALEKYNHLFTETLYSKEAFQFRNRAQIFLKLFYWIRPAVFRKQVFCY